MQFHCGVIGTVLEVTQFQGLVTGAEEDFKEDFLEEDMSDIISEGIGVQQAKTEKRVLGRESTVAQIWE
jgi:hypothetical protein